MRHVGNVHPQTPVTARKRLQGNGVVEIAGVCRVDGDDCQRGQVEPTGRDRLVEFLRLAPGLVQGVGGEGVRQVELAEDRERVHPRLAPRTEHFHDHPFAVLRRRGEANHFEDHFVVAPGALGAGIAHGDGLGEERAVHGDVARRARLEIGAHELPGLALEDLEDFAARAFGAGPPPVQADQHHVAAGGVAGPLPRDVDVGRPGVWPGGGGPGRQFGRRPHEAEALGSPLEDADGLVWRCAGSADRRPGTAARLDQVVGPIDQRPAVDHPLHGRFQRIELVPGQAETQGDCPRLQRPIVRAAHQLQYRLFQGVVHNRISPTDSTDQNHHQEDRVCCTLSSTNTASGTSLAPGYSGCALIGQRPLRRRRVSR